MKTREEIEELVLEKFKHKMYNPFFNVAFVEGYIQCQEDINKEPFNNFYLRLKRFVSNVQVNDLMSEEEKEMIIHVCNEKLNKQDNEK